MSRGTGPDEGRGTGRGTGRFTGRFLVRAPGRASARASGRSATAARTPFVVLVVTLLAGGLISLLLLNAAVNQDSFTLDKLQNETTGYTDEQQALQQDVDGYSAPGALEQRARRLGMVPGGDPAFLDPNGKVQGSPSPATAPPAPPPSTTAPATTVPTIEPNAPPISALAGGSGGPVPRLTPTPSAGTAPTTPTTAPPVNPTPTSSR